MILEQFDPCKTAVINPCDICSRVEGMPKVAVTCFARSTFARMLERLGGVEIARLSCANMEFPIYKCSFKGTPIALFISDVGAPSTVGMLEELFVLGVEKVVMFGNCGVLDKNIADCSIIIPNAAVRDEGTSFHYAPPSDEIAVNPKYIPEFIEILKSHGCSYTVGKTWTTDAFYRETRKKVEERKSRGCICVEMECSAVAALAQFREKEVFHFFYAGDNLDAEKWDERSLSNHALLDEKDKAALLALELAVKIA